MHGDYDVEDRIEFPQIEETPLPKPSIEDLRLSIDDPDATSFRWKANTLFRQGVKFHQMWEALGLTQEAFHRIYNRNSTKNMKLKRFLRENGGVV